MCHRAQVFSGGESNAKDCLTLGEKQSFLGRMKRETGWPYQHLHFWVSASKTGGGKQVYFVLNYPFVVIAILNNVMVFFLSYLICMRFFFLRLHVCVCNRYMLGAHGGQKNAVAPLEVKLGSCELLRGCWDPNLRPLQEQVIFTTEPSSNPAVICSKDQEETRNPLTPEEMLFRK